jgi:hypothetical protein
MALKTAEINPLPSATAIPSIATSTVPSGAKPVKFVTSEVRMRCSPCMVSRLSARTTSFVPGCTTDTPIHAVTAERMMTSAARMTNNVAGCGRMFPALSMAPRKRFMRESLATPATSSVAVVFKVIPPERAARPDSMMENRCP